MMARASALACALINLAASACWLLAGMFMAIAAFYVYQLLQVVA